MDKFVKIVIRTVSGIVFAAALAASVWLGYASVFIGQTPDDNDITPVSYTDIDSSNTTEIDDSLPTEETVNKKFVRITTNTYLRKKNSYNSEHIALLEKDSECLYLNEDNDYYNVACDDGKKGWVLKERSELFEKDVVITHIPKNPVGDPFPMTDTKEGDDLGEIFKSYGTVGASLAIIKDGKVAYHYEYGYANKEKADNKISITENTKYRIASVSKVFTSMLAMAEVEDGKLDLDAKLSDLFGFNFYNPKYPNTPVTMRMLLTHTAGLSGKAGLYSEPLIVVASGKDYYIYKPGNGFYYSNLGMGIAGAAVEKASDQTISQYARDRFFQPMGIDASYDASYLSDKSLVADCYSNGSLKRSNEVLTRPMERKKGKPGDVYSLGQGGLLISAVDLAKISTLLLNDGVYDGKQYLSHDSVEQILTVHLVKTKSKYEQSIGIRKYTDLIGDRDMYYHTGSYYGIYALMAIDPNDKSGVIVITSGAHSTREDNTIFEVCNAVLNYCYDGIL